MVKLLIVLICGGWAFDLANRWIHLQEKLQERPDILQLAQSGLLEGILTLAIVFLSLKLLKKRFSFLRPNRMPVGRSVLLGMTWGFVIFGISTFIISPWLRSLNFFASEAPVLPELFSDFRWIPIWIFLAVFCGGFIEELQRIFALRVFEEGFGKKGVLAALVLSTVVFGFGHLYQGPNSAINIGLTGLAYALLYLRTRDPIVPMTAHAVFDLIGVTLGFALFGPK